MVITEMAITCMSRRSDASQIQGSESTQIEIVGDQAAEERDSI